ncbi:MAG: hypothetical protein ACKN9V_05680 [Pseudomonadota bacterium]
MKALVFLTLNLMILAVVGKLEGLKLSSVFQPSALVMIFGPQLIYLLVNTGQGFGALLKRTLTNRVDSSDEDLFRGASHLGLLQGILGALLGTIYLFGHLDSSEGLGKGMAFALCCLFYAVFPMIAFFPFLKKSNGKATLAFSGAAVVLIIIASLLVLEGLKENINASRRNSSVDSSEKAERTVLVFPEL